MTYRALAMVGAADELPEWSNVLSNLQNALATATHTGRLPQVAFSHFRYAECLHKKGDLPAALEQLTEAESLFAKMKMNWWSEQAAGLRGRIAAAKPFVWFAPYVDGPPKLAA